LSLGKSKIGFRLGRSVVYLQLAYLTMHKRISNGSSNTQQMSNEMDHDGATTNMWKKEA
jgi:hypothetical protein